MPVWLLLLIKIALPYILQDLVKWGLMDAVTAEAIKTYEDFKGWIKGLKTYQEFPAQKQSGGFHDPTTPAITNFNK